MAVCVHSRHEFTKSSVAAIDLLEGEGVAGDAHCGALVKHRSRVARDPNQPNLRQVHLLHQEMVDAIAAEGFSLPPGAIGENVRTMGIDLLALPENTELQIGPDARLRVTGLRNPCLQLDRYQDGLMRAFLKRTADGQLVRLAGIMAVVVRGGTVHAGDSIEVHKPAPPHRPLGPV